MLPNHTDEYLDLIERYRREAEAEIPHRWRNPALQEMAAYSGVCPSCEASARREKMALAGMGVALLFSFVAVIAAILTMPM